MIISLKKRKAKYAYGSVSGYFSFRGEKSIWFESTLERDLLTLLAFDDTVIDVDEQPFTIEYANHNGRIVPYTPDFLITFKTSPFYSMHSPYSKPLLVEVKPHDKLKKDFKKLRARFKIATRYAQQNDYIFKIYDDRKIRGTALQNILFLKRYRKTQFDYIEENRILDHLRSIGHTQIDHLLEALYAIKTKQGIALSQLYHLMYHKKIGFDVGQPINSWSTIWLNVEETYEEGILNALG